MHRALAAVLIEVFDCGASIHMVDLLVDVAWGSESALCKSEARHFCKGQYSLLQACMQRSIGFTLYS